MNILNLATTTSGGAGIATANIDKLFNKHGFNSVVITKADFINEGGVFKKVSRRLRKMVDGNITDDNYYFFNQNESKQIVTAEKILGLTKFAPDVILLHWVSNFINSKTIQELRVRTDAQILWLMMDNAPLTGGCHYPWDCKGYQNNCNNCPAILKESMKDIAADNLSLKKKYIPDDLKLIAVSETDYCRAKLSSLFKTENVHKVFLPIDHELFKPGDKQEARKLLKLDPDKRVILYGARSVSEKRKGVAYFRAALESLKTIAAKNNDSLSNYQLLIIGKADNKAPNYDELGINVVRVGHLDEQKLIKAYQASDLFVSTSLEDSGPMMINQSVMCGLPVVAFDVGVARDLVINKETGFLVKEIDYQNLAIHIYKILTSSQDEYNYYSNNCRNNSMNLFRPKVFIESFKSIIRNND